MFNQTWKNVEKINNGDVEADVVSRREQWGIKEKIWKNNMLNNKKAREDSEAEKSNLKDGRIKKLWEVGEEKKKQFWNKRINIIL